MASPERLAIIGTGLIGASAGLAAQRAGVSSVTGWDPDPDSLGVAVERGAVEATGSIAEAVAAADLVLVATPVGELPSVVREALERAPEETTVTDVGSTKRPVSAAAGGDPRFVGGHPICGAETRGPERATADLFDGATWFLTSENEWYKAAYFDPQGYYWKYATSSDTAPSNLLIDPDPGNSATYVDKNGNYTLQGPYHFTEVGSHENSQSPYGTYDQNGNVVEWNETVIYLGSGNWIVRGKRGGCAGNNFANLLSSDRSFGYPTADYLDAVGFRVASVPEPNSLLMTAIIAIGLVFWKRRNSKATY
jgi:hypothetical protein